MKGTIQLPQQRLASVKCSVKNQKEGKLTVALRAENMQHIIHWNFSLVNTHTK
jgi:uncharacterized protein VirK/YbjX